MGRYKNPHYQRDWDRKRYGRKPRVRATPEVVKLLKRQAKLKYRYGMNLADFESMLESQGGACAICNHNKILVVDHCHNTGKVRGLLCQGCNHGLGHFADDTERLDNAIGYLKGVK